VTAIAPRFWLVANASGNLVVMTAEDASLVAGLQDPELVKLALATLEAQKAPPVKYAICLDGERAANFRDGGWGRRGAITMAQELLFSRMRKPVGEVAADTDLPSMGFSEVVQLHVKGEDTHVIRQRAGSTDAETILHFEGSGIAFLGPAFTSDGYPAIDTTRGGAMLPMMQTVDYFVSAFAARADHIEPIVPGRGPVATMAELKAYTEMLHAVHDRVAALVKAGKTVAAVQAAKPTAQFDAKWGQGPVSPDRFVAMVFESVSKE
jgi:hypothetical protein